MRRLVAGGVALASLACGARKPVIPPADPLLGRTSMRVLAAPEIEKVEVSDVRITPVYASDENRPPEYPAYALKAGCRDAKVPVRVYVGADGNVTGQGDVPDRPLGGDPCLVAFRAAATGAVKDWRFAPAFRQQQVPGPDRDGDGRPDGMRWEQTAIAIYVDFEFTFAVVGGKGVVRSR